jgi:hypothetical protein
MARFNLALAAVQPRGRTDYGGIAAQSAPLATGAVSFGGVSPGRYTLRVLASPPGSTWRLQSVTVGGREVNELPFDVTEDIGNVQIVMTDRPASLAGRVTFTVPAAGAPSVRLFPAERRLWPDARALGRRFRLARTSATGDFSIADIPPGDYLVVAVVDESAANWPDATFLAELLPLAETVKIEPGSAAAVALTVKTVVKR